jgi:hypothetical protein
MSLVHDFKKHGDFSVTSFAGFPPTPAPFPPTPQIDDLVGILSQGAAW